MAVEFTRTTRSLNHDSPRIAITMWLLAFILLAAWLAWFVLSHVMVYEVSKKARVEVMQSPHSIAPLVPSKILTTRLVLGQEVKQGDILVELDASNERLKLLEEQARIRALPLRIAAINKEISSLERAKTENQKALSSALQTAQFHSQEAAVVEEFAQENAQRLNDESSAGGVAKIEALRALADAQKSSATKAALGAEVQRVERDAISRADQDQAQIENLRHTVLTLEGELLTSKVTIARLEQEIEKYVLRAPISGRVGEVFPLKKGAYVAEGQKLATIVPSGDLIIIADFEPAAVTGRIYAGQSSQMRLDGFPWAQYGTIEAKVTRVSSEIRDGLVRVEFAPTLAKQSKILLQHGLPGTVEVNVERITPAVLVLRAAGQLLPKQQPSQTIEQAQITSELTP